MLDSAILAKIATRGQSQKSYFGITLHQKSHFFTISKLSKFQSHKTFTPNFGVIFTPKCLH
jgi:hypothetical protein